MLADVASRAIVGLLNSSDLVAFLAYFNHRFPLPQSPSWTHVMLDLDLSSSVISTLRGQRLELRRWMTNSVRKVGMTGDAMHLQQTPNRTSKPSTNADARTCSLPLPPGFELDCTEMASRLDTKLWRKPCVTWRKPSSWLGTMTQEKPTVLKN